MNSDLAKIITIVYIVITFLIPILYFLIYRLKPIKLDEEGNVIPKDYGKHFAISLLIMVVFILVKIMVSLDVGVFNTVNYYINYDFSSNETKEDIKQTTTKVTSTTTTTTTTTTKVTTTTKPIDGKHYERVSIIEGEQINKGQTTKGFDIVEVNGVTYIDGYLVANKTYFLPEDYVPVDTYKKADVIIFDLKNMINDSKIKSQENLFALEYTEVYYSKSEKMLVELYFICATSLYFIIPHR